MLSSDNFPKIPRMLSVESLCTAFQPEYDENFYYPGETHNFWELVFISEGKASIAKNDRIFNLSRGDAVFHPPMEFHRIWSCGERFRPIIISFAVSGDVLGQLSDGIFSLNLAQQHVLEELVQESRDAFTADGIYLTPRNDSPMALQAIVTKLELFLLDILKTNSSEKKADKTRPAQQFSRIIEVMNNHIHQNLSVEEIAELSTISVSNLKKICHRYTGVGPAKHFFRLKMIRAMHLLKSGQSVTEVSEGLGFSTQSYFSVAFRRETGLSPGSLKK